MNHDLHQSTPQQWMGEAPRRSGLVRLAWGALATLVALCACGAVIAGTFVPPEMETVFCNGLRYSVNMVHLAYFGAAVGFPLAAFALWKASHRGGLSFWRATVRPAMMSASAGLGGTGFIFEQFFAVGTGQTVGLGAIGAAAVAFLFAWLLRGPDVRPRPGDDYWNRTLAWLFAACTVASAAGATHFGRSWWREGRSFELSVPQLRQIEVPDSHVCRTFDMGRSTTLPYKVPQSRYNHSPVAAGLLALLTLGAISEMRYRRRRARARSELML